MVKCTSAIFFRCDQPFTVRSMKAAVIVLNLNFHTRGRISLHFILSTHVNILHLVSISYPEPAIFRRRIESSGIIHNRKPEILAFFCLIATFLWIIPELSILPLKIACSGYEIDLVCNKHYYMAEINAAR